MISVLIPIYNYNVLGLLNEIHDQLMDCKIPFEIICLDDGSDDDFVKQNNEIKNHSNTSLIVSRSNQGRIKSRQILSEHSKFEWLLFLDSDVMPKHKDFISKYLNFINSKYEVVYGGFIYNKFQPEKDKILRWKYGKKYENKFINWSIIADNFLTAAGGPCRITGKNP